VAAKHYGITSVTTSNTQDFHISCNFRSKQAKSVHKLFCDYMYLDFQK